MARARPKGPESKSIKPLTAYRKLQKEAADKAGAVASDAANKVKEVAKDTTSK